MRYFYTVFDYGNAQLGFAERAAVEPDHFNTVVGGGQEDNSCMRHFGIYLMLISFFI